MFNESTAVIKTTKLCNLRCKYCYEFEHLADPTVMLDEEISIMIERLSELSTHFESKMKFCWHGGEPLLVKREKYLSAFSAQEQSFEYNVKNIIQTNLFHLNGKNLETLRLFDSISTSFDPIDNERVSISEMSTQDSVALNMGKLRTEGLPFGVVTVLHAGNYDKIDATFEFFNRSSLSFRVLPYYREANVTATDKYGLSLSTIKQCYLRLLELWFTKGTHIQIYPIYEYVLIATRFHMNCGNPYRYDKFSMEHVFIIDTNGDIYTAGTAYNKLFAYGNIFDDDMRSIVHSDGRKRACERSASLMSTACENCKFFGACPGYYIAEQTDVELAANDTGKSCPIAFDCIEYALGWIEKMSDAALAGLTNPTENDGLEVSR